MQLSFRVSQSIPGPSQVPDTIVEMGQSDFNFTRTLMQLFSDCGSYRLSRVVDLVFIGEVK